MQLVEHLDEGCSVLVNTYLFLRLDTWSNEGRRQAGHAPHVMLFGWVKLWVEVSQYAH